MPFFQESNHALAKVVRGETPSKPRTFLLLASAVVATAFVAIMYLALRKEPYVVVEAYSDVVSYRVRRPQVATVPLVNATVRGKIENCPMDSAADGTYLFTGLVTPSAGSIVTYRFTPTRVSIAIDAGNASAGSITADDGRKCPLPNRVNFIVPTEMVAKRPLPLVGPADIGAEMSVPESSGVLLRPVKNFMSGGKVQVFGRASAKPFNGDLYPTSNSSIPLPAGGRVSSGDNLDPAANDSGAPAFYGVVCAEEKSFMISATTVSKELRLHRPGLSQETEIFGLGMLTLIFSDPSVLCFTIFVAVFSFSLQTLKTMHDVACNTRAEKEKNKAKSKQTETGQTAYDQTATDDTADTPAPSPKTDTIAPDSKKVSFD